MPPLVKASVVYNILRERTHHTLDGVDTQLNLFDNATAPNFQDTEYWMFSDLNSLYGDMQFDMGNMYINTYNAMHTATSYEIQPNKFDTIFKSHIDTIQTKYDPSPVAPYVTHAHRRGTDLKLTRLAAWSLTYQHPSMIAARMFFLIPNASYDDVLNATKQFSRIHLRKTAASLNHQISGIIKQYGGDYGACYGQINRAFFYGLDASYIKNAFSIPDNPKYPLTDYLNANALAAFNHAIQKAIMDFSHARIKDIGLFYSLLSKHLTDGRMDLFRKTDHGPEHNIDPEHIDKVKSKLKKLETNFIRKNLNVKIK